MELLKQTIEQIAQKKRQTAPALMTHIVLGYPSLDESIEIAVTMAKCGVSIIELQIPFSDPIADGPTIMEANEVARLNGVTTPDCLNAIKRLRKQVNVPLLVVSYLNPIFNYKSGMETFFVEAKKAGANGIAIPDIPVEEKSLGYWDGARNAGLFPVPFVSPLTSNERLKIIAPLARGGFVYCYSTTSTTGAKASLSKDIPDYLARVSSYIKDSLAIGFGISAPEHIKALTGHVDIAIVGSATIDVIKKAKKAKRIKEVADFIKSLVF